MDIRQFQRHVRSLSERLDTLTPERRILYLVSEVGETVDEVMDLLNAGPDAPDAELAARKERIGMELYDVIWNAVDLANMLDIDLEAAFAKKIAINATRKWRRSGTIHDGE
jgi:NTP pyrophosphatase (non-canonical NTP hydrolase)